ncbi:MAG TPA: ankyrin repeat domain-containing protein [Candidatus Baltobacteraceae bacterium]|nr:ankyrin repeat domain-containing protein [Candidatus Baltobacteraceae bacterium]
MKPEVKAILDKVKQTADFGYVAFESISDTNTFGCNALHCVIVRGDYESAKVLIENGININQKGEDGYTPLHQACSFGQKEIVKLLLENGADTFARTEGDLPFTKARLSGHNEICEVLKPYMDKKGGDESSRKRQNHLEKLDSSIKELKKQIKKHCK